MSGIEMVQEFGAESVEDGCAGGDVDGCFDNCRSYCRILIASAQVTSADRAPKNPHSLERSQDTLNIGTPQTWKLK